MFTRFSKKRPKQIVILGAYGQNNIGDEAMLESLLTYMDREKYRISCNSMNPKATKRKYNIESFHTGLKVDFWRKVKEFVLADAIIYGGGALLVELHMSHMNKRTPLYRVFLVNLFCKIFQKKVAFIGISVDIKNIFSIYLTRIIVRMADICFVRDTISFDFLRNNGCKKVNLGADLAFLLQIPIFQSVNSMRLPEHLRICILPVHRIPLFESYSERYLRALATFADFMADNGHHVEFYPMRIENRDAWNDLYVLGRLQALTDRSPQTIFHKGIPLDPSDFARYISTFDCVISSRYHGLVFALLNNVSRIISLSNFEKNVSLMRELGLDRYSLESPEVTRDKLVSLILQVVPNELSLTKKKHEYVFAARARARKMISELLQNL